MLASVVATVEDVKAALTQSERTALGTPEIVKLVISCVFPLLFDELPRSMKSRSPGGRVAILVDGMSGVRNSLRTALREAVT